MIATGNDATPRLNLFLHQVTPNAALAQRRPAVARRRRRNRIANPPLALDLHYLLTAYASADLQAEMLLGYAHAAAARNAGARARRYPQGAQSAKPAVPAAAADVYQALRASDLADQIEQIKITPDDDEHRRAVEAVDRAAGALSADRDLHGDGGADRVAKAAARSPLPVLSRGKVDPVTHREPAWWCRPVVVPPFPEIEIDRAPNPQIAAELGDTLDVQRSQPRRYRRAISAAAGQSRASASSTTITPEVGRSGTRIFGAVRAAERSRRLSRRHLRAQPCNCASPASRAPRVTNALPLTIAPQHHGTAGRDQPRCASGNLTLTPDLCAAGAAEPARVADPRRHRGARRAVHRADRDAELRLPRVADRQLLGALARRRRRQPADRPQHVTPPDLHRPADRRCCHERRRARPNDWTDANQQLLVAEFARLQRQARRRDRRRARPMRSSRAASRDAGAVCDRSLVETFGLSPFER